MSFARSAVKSLAGLADHFMARPTGPRILIYHQVGAGLGRQMEVTVAAFRGHLEALASGYEVVTLDEAVRRWQEPGADRLVVLTFDDGYRDTYVTVFPLLREKGHPFTLYLATESIETGRPLGPVPGAEPLTWDQIGEMSGSGLVTIGAHTHTHRDLRHAGLSEVLEEIDVSNQLIRGRLGLDPRHFAYPWGWWSAAADGVVRDRYQTAVLGGTPSPEASPQPHRLHRYPIQLSDGTRHFRSRLRGGLRLEEWLRRARAGYRGP